MQHKQEKYVDGDFKGLKFFVPVFEKLSEAVESYTEATVLALLNQQVQSDEDCKGWHPTIRGLSARKLFMMSQAAVAKGDLDEAKELMEQCKAKTLA